MQLILIHSKLVDIGVDVELYLHGNGDLVTKLANLKNDKIHFTEALDSDNWLQLFDESKFVQSSVDFIRNLDLEYLRQYQTNARKYAEANLDWSNSVAILEDILSKQY